MTTTIQTLDQFAEAIKQSKYLRNATVKLRMLVDLVYEPHRVAHAEVDRMLTTFNMPSKIQQFFQMLELNHWEVFECETLLTTNKIMDEDDTIVGIRVKQNLGGVFSGSAMAPMGSATQQALVAPYKKFADSFDFGIATHPEANLIKLLNLACTQRYLQEHREEIIEQCQP